MERKIEETFEFKDKKLKCIESEGMTYPCIDCYFGGHLFANCKAYKFKSEVGDCLKSNRKDSKNIVFIEVKED